MLRERHRDRPLLCLPTGSGKTSVAAEIIRSAVAKGHRCIFLVHRAELVDQAVDRLAEFGVPAGRIHAGHPEDRALPVQVACIPTLVRRKHWPAQLVIVDECSHAVSESWSKCLARYDGVPWRGAAQVDGAFVIGLTATPIRLDGKGLGDIFGAIVEPVSTRALIAAGYLVEPRVFAPPVDLSKLPVRGGDYAIPELAARMQKLTGSITKTWLERAAGMKTVAFAVNIEHSQAIVEAFVALGVRAAHIDGGTAHGQRADTLADLRAGRLDMVSNCMVLSEGWDLPSLQCAILARPTKSLALFRQMVGRVMRPPGPVLVLDHAGCHHEHGVVTEPYEWSLEDKPKRKAEDVAESVRTCPKCYAVLPPAVRVCPECGDEMTREEAEPPGVDNPGVLVEFEPPKRGTREEERAWYTSVVNEASVTRRSLGWARYRFKDRFGVWPKLKQVEIDEYECPSCVWERKQLGPREVMRCKNCYDVRAPGSVTMPMIEGRGTLEKW